MKTLQIAVRLKLKSMKTLANGNQTEDAEHEPLANRGTGENEKHEHLENGSTKQDESMIKIPF